MPRLSRRVIRFPRSKMVAITALILTSLFCGIASSWPAAAMTSRTDLSELPLTFPVQSSEIAAYFNQIARPEDIAAFPEPFVHLLPQVTAGQKMVFFRSWVEAERELEGLLDQIDVVGYNPEHWEHTPVDEQQNLPATVQRAAEFAHAHGVRFMFAPDRLFAQEHLSQVAPYADAISLQGQRLQDDPQAFAAWTRDMISVACASNPEAQIYVQVGATRGTASEMFAAIQTVSNDIDGIGVWSMPRTLNILQEFVTLIRESPQTIEATPPPTSTVAPETVVPAESDTATFTATYTAMSTATPTSTATATPTPTPTPTSAKMTVEPPPPTVVPAPPTPSPQTEQDTQSGAWPKGIALVAGGAVIALLLGIGLARRQGGG